MKRREEDQVKCKNCTYYQYVMYPDGTPSPAGWCILDMSRINRPSDVLFFCDKHYSKRDFEEDSLVARLEQKAW